MSDGRALTSEEAAALFERLTGYDSLLLAVSGGSDSMALMHLAAEWARVRPLGKPCLTVATVDHGLRAESARESAWVGAHAAAIGLPHETLRWTGEKPASGIQAEARRVRYALLHEFAARLGQNVAIVTAHHRDDQVETFLMRLARGSGIDGLSGMRFDGQDGRKDHGAAFEQFGSPPALERPFLDVPKARLVASLKARGLAWIEDPSNSDERFERVRLREARPALDRLGLDPEQIARSIRRLQRARYALGTLTDEVLRSAVALNAGAYAAIDSRHFDDRPEELRIRLLGRLLAAYGGQIKPPRLSKVERLAHELASGTGTHTLSGCIVVSAPGHVEVFREFGREGIAAARLAPGETAVWDRRFLVRAGGSSPEVSVRALGDDGYKALGGSHDAIGHMPYRAAITLPSFWRGHMLLAAPHLTSRHGEPGTGAAPRDDCYRATFIFEPAPG